MQEEIASTAHLFEISNRPIDPRADIPRKATSSTQAAILKLLAAATGTRIVSTDPSERIAIGLAFGMFSFGLFEPSLPIGKIVVAKAVPVR